MMCEEVFSKRAKFFCSRAAFKSSFFPTFDGYVFDYDIVLVLVFFR